MVDVLARYQPSAILEFNPSKRQKKSTWCSVYFSPSWLEGKKISLIGSPEVKPFINR